MAFEYYVVSSFQLNLETKVLTPISCSTREYILFKYWELFKMPVSIIAVL